LVVAEPVSVVEAEPLESVAVMVWSAPADEVTVGKNTKVALTE
jgi:hypothetical protein